MSYLLENVEGTGLTSQNTTFFDSQGFYQNRGELETVAFLFGERVVRPALDAACLAFFYVSRLSINILPGVQAAASSDYRSFIDGGVHYSESSPLSCHKARVFEDAETKADEMFKAYLAGDIEKADQYRIEALISYKGVEKLSKANEMESFESHILSKKAKLESGDSKKRIEFFREGISITKRVINQQRSISKYKKVEADPEVARYKKLLGDQLYALSKEVEKDEGERLLDEADKCFQEVIELYQQLKGSFLETSYILMAGRADIENLKGKPEKAIDDTEKVLKLAKNSSSNPEQDMFVASLYRKLADQWYIFAKGVVDSEDKESLFLEAYNNYQASQQIILEFEGPNSRNFAKTLLAQGDVQYNRGLMKKALKKYAGALFILENITLDLENDEDISAIREKFNIHREKLGLFLEESRESPGETVADLVWKWAKKYGPKVKENISKAVERGGRCAVSYCTSTSDRAFGACSIEAYNFLWDIWNSSS